LKLERFDHMLGPIIANRVNKSFQFSCNSFHSSISTGTLTTIDATYSVSIILVNQFEPPNTIKTFN
jgi:hypothetical protein